MTDEELIARLREFRGNQMADPRTAPEFVFLDPDLPVSEWEKQYSMDVVYVRADRIEALVQGLKTAVAVVEESGRMRGQAEARADRLEAALKCLIERRRPMIDMHDYTDEDLLRELVRRNGVLDAPTSRTMHRYEVLIGIGKGNHCYITFGIRDDVEALKGEQQ